jgi:hypothetical protein
VSTDDALRRIVVHLDAAGIPYFLTGSFAASAHGFLRTTYDFDFVIDPDADSLRAFVQRLPSDEYYVDERAADEALRRRAMFNVVDQATQWKCPAPSSEARRRWNRVRLTSLRSARRPTSSSASGTTSRRTSSTAAAG